MVDQTNDSRAKRMAVRFTDDDLAFLAEHAEDEGVEPATLVRMIVSRLRKGRQPLIAMMEQGAIAPRQPYPPSRPGMIGGVYQMPPPPTADADVADDVLASRLAEMESAEIVPLHQQDGDETPAIPLVRVPRQQYNPGRN